MTAEFPSILSGSVRARLCGFIVLAIFALLAPSLRPARFPTAAGYCSR